MRTRTVANTERVRFTLVLCCASSSLTFFYIWMKLAVFERQQGQADLALKTVSRLEVADSKSIHARLPAD